MKKIYVLLILALAMFTLSGAAYAASSRTFLAKLSGAEEVPVRATDARGMAVFHLDNDETTLSYVLTVSNIDNVVAAHIHCGAPGVSGPVGVTLYSGAAPAGGPSNGILAQGTIVAPDAGNSCGWVTLADVVSAMRSGNTYTNVHTSDGIAPINTGPGDFASGEIRGQINEAGE